MLESQHKLENLRQKIDLQRTRLGEEKAKIEKQSKELGKERITLDQQKAHLLSQAVTLSLRERALDEKDSQLREMENEQKFYFKKNEKEIKALLESKYELEKARQDIDLNRSEVEEVKAQIEKQSVELRKERESLKAKESEKSHIQALDDAKAKNISIICKSRSRMHAD